jgi:hypothetical protein
VQQKVGQLSDDFTSRVEEQEQILSQSRRKKQQTDIADNRNSDVDPTDMH